MISLEIRRFLISCRDPGLLVDQMTDDERRLSKICMKKWWAIIPRRIGQPDRMVLTKRGEMELARPREEKPGRVYCVNPLCGSSSAQERFPGADEIICGRCFKMAGDLRTEYRALRAKYRKVERMALRRGRDTTALARLDMQIGTNWRKIRDFFQQPEQPEGLDAFLAELGFNNEDDDG
jgi:hypothetical protein